MVRGHRGSPWIGVPPVLLHQGDGAGGRPPRRRPRSWKPGVRVLDVGCGPGRQPVSSPAGDRVHWIDITPLFVDLARREAPAGPRSCGSTPAQLTYDAEFHAVICLCQGAFGLGDGRRRGRRRPRGHRPGAATRRPPRAEAPSAPTSPSGSRRRRLRRRHRPRPTSGPRSATPMAGRGRGRPVDRLLHAARAAPAPRPGTGSRSSGSAASSPGAYGDEPRRPPNRLSCWSSPAATLTRRSSPSESSVPGPMPALRSSDALDARRWARSASVARRGRTGGRRGRRRPGTSSWVSRWRAPRPTARSWAASRSATSKSMCSCCCTSGRGHVGATKSAARWNASVRASARRAAG